MYKNTVKMAILFTFFNTTFCFTKKIPNFMNCILRIAQKIMSQLQSIY